MPDRVTAIECYAAPLRADRLASLNHAFGSAIGRVSNPTPVWWIAPDRFAAETARTRVISLASARLGLAFGGLGQLSAGLLREPCKVLSTTQRRLLVSGLLVELDRRGGLGSLTPTGSAAPAAGLVDFVIEQIDRSAFGEEVPTSSPVESDRARDIGLIERAYRAELKRNQLVDAAGQLQAVYELLQTDRPALEPFCPRLIAIDGDVPYRPLELKLLAALVRHAQVVLLSVATKHSSTGDDPTQVIEPWAGWIEGVSPTATTHLVRPADASSVSRRAVLRRLDQPVSKDCPFPRADRLGLSVLASGTADDEWRRVADAVKKRLVSRRCQAEEIVIAVPGVSQARGLATAALEDAGIPWAIDRRPRLGETPRVQTLLSLLRLAESDWDADPLLEAVLNRSLTWLDFQRGADLGRFSGPRAATEAALLGLKHTSGRERLLARLAAIQESASGSSETKALAASRPIESVAGIVLPKLHQLDKALQSFGSAAQPLEWLVRLGESLDSLGYQPIDPVQDAAAQQALAGLLADAQTLADWRGAPPPVWSLADLRGVLADAATRLPVNTPRDEVGRVRVVAYDTASRMAPRVVVVVGLEESALTGQEDSGRRLFGGLVTSATDESLLTYPSLNRKGDALAPSPLLAELEAMFEPGALRDQGEVSPQQPAGLRTLLDLGEPTSRLEARLQAVADESGRRLAGLLQEPSARHQAAALCGALEAGHARSTGDAFGPFEGVFQGPEAKSALAQHYGPSHHWSPSQLELYANCPFKFFMQSILHAEPLEPPRLEIDPGRRGALVHGALAKLHSQQTEPDASFDPEKIVEAFRSAIRSEINAEYSSPADAAIAEIEAREAAEWANLYPDQLAAYRDLSQKTGLTRPLFPRHLEVRFGPRTRDAHDEAPLSTDEPFLLRYGDQELLLVGRIDRIDLGLVGDQAVFAVIDYKTSSKSGLDRDSVTSGRLAQLVLYTLAAEEKLLRDQGAVPVLAGYWMVKQATKAFDHEKSSRGGSAQGVRLTPNRVEQGTLTPDPQWREIVDAVRSAVERAVTGARRGDFAMSSLVPDCTSRCDYRTVCRVGQARAVGKSQVGFVEEDSLE